MCLLGSHPVPLVLCYEHLSSVTDSGGRYSIQKQEEGILGSSGLSVLRDKEQNLASYPRVLPLCVKLEDVP